MIVRRAQLRNFRNYERADLELGESVNVLFGHNGAGKTNLLEAIYTGSVGRSCRTRVDSQVVRFGQEAARVELTVSDQGSEHLLTVGIERAGRKVFSFDGAPVERLDQIEQRPLVAVFMPDRMMLIKGEPGARRAHLDQLIGALWPARAGARRGYAAALGQRNALLSRGGASAAELAAWDVQLAGCGFELIENRRSAFEQLGDRFSSFARLLGLNDETAVSYRPRSDAGSVDELICELEQRHESDRQRGFTTHGPHRDDFRFSAAGVDLRTYGSQGQQRVALLALLLAERDAIAEQRGRAPLTLLDDVMSELDRDRRGLLIDELAARGQCVITTTEAEHVPEGDGGWRLIEVADGRLVEAGSQ